MWDRIERLTEPAIEALSLVEVKQACRIDADDDNAFLAGAIRAARQIIEGPDGAGLALVASEWQMRLDAMPAEIVVPIGPVIGIGTVSYLDDGGVLQTIAPAAYQWRRGHFEARIRPALGTIWPAVRRRFELSK